jgi:hypothetical protein
VVVDNPNIYIRKATNAATVAAGGIYLDTSTGMSLIGPNLLVEMEDVVWVVSGLSAASWTSLPGGYARRTPASPSSLSTLTWTPMANGSSAQCVGHLLQGQSRPWRRTNSTIVLRWLNALSSFDFAAIAPRQPWKDSSRKKMIMTLQAGDKLLSLTTNSPAALKSREGLSPNQAIAALAISSNFAISAR